MDRTLLEPVNTKKNLMDESLLHFGEWEGDVNRYAVSVQWRVLPQLAQDCHAVIFKMKENGNTFYMYDVVQDRNVLGEARYFAPAGLIVNELKNFPTAFISEWRPYSVNYSEFQRAKIDIFNEGFNFENRNAYDGALKLCAQQTWTYKSIINPSSKGEALPAVVIDDTHNSIVYVAYQIPSSNLLSPLVIDELIEVKAKAISSVRRSLKNQKNEQKVFQSIYPIEI